MASDEPLIDLLSSPEETEPAPPPPPSFPPFPHYPFYTSKPQSANEEDPAKPHDAAEPLISGTGQHKAVFGVPPAASAAATAPGRGAKARPREREPIDEGEVNLRESSFGKTY